MSATGPWTRVILLTPPQSEGGGLSEPLQQEFTVRDWFAVQVHDPYLALTELFVREKAQATRSSWGLQRMEQLALVITHAHNWAHIDWLAESVRRYVPHASVWVAGDDHVRPFDGRALHDVFSNDQAPTEAAPQGAQLDPVEVETSRPDEEYR